MFDPVISAGAILVALIAAITSHRLTIHRERLKEIRSAISEFKDSFSPMLASLMSREVNPAMLVREHFPAHKEAAIKLLGRLPRNRAIKFNQAWREYQELHTAKKSMGILSLLAAEVVDPSGARDPSHIYEVNSQRKKEVVSVVNRVFNAVDL